MKRNFANGIIIFGMLAAVIAAYGPAADARRPRVAAGVWKDSVPDKSLTALFTVELAKLAGIEVVERAEMDRIFSEWQNAAFAGELEQQIKLGQAAGADYFVWVTLDTASGKGVFEIVSAATGRIISRKRISAAPEALVREAAGHVEQALAKFGSAAVSSAAWLVLSRPTVLPATSNNTAAAERILEALSDSLLERGVPLLHRRHAAELATERWWAEKGLVVFPTQSKALQGARFLLNSRISFEQAAPQLSFALVDAATGGRIAGADFSLGVSNGWAIALDKAAAWAAGRMEQALKPVEMPKGDRLQPETQQAFYQGVLLFNEGRYPDSLECFARAHALEPAFAQPVQWIQECFAAAGLDAVVKRLEQYHTEVTGTAYMGIPFYYNNWKRVGVAPGSALLGLTYRDSRLRELAEELLETLVSNLERRGPVFFPEDLAALAMEYDTFVGLESVEGGRWRTAPLLLFENMISGHLSVEGEKVRLELARVTKLEPKSCRRVIVELAGTEAERAGQTAQALDRLFAEVGACGSRAPLLIEETVEELKNKLQAQYKDSTYLKLLLKDPRNVSLDKRFPANKPNVSDWDAGGWGGYAAFGLHEHIIFCLDDANFEKPWQEMALVTRLNPTRINCDAPDGVRKLSMEELIMRERSIAERYPEHPAGVAARYNVLLWDLKPENYRQTRDELARIITLAESKFSENFDPFAFQGMRTLHAALSVTLGENIEPLREKYNFYGIFLVYPPGKFNINPNTWLVDPLPSMMPEWYGLSEDELRQATPIFLYLLPESFGKAGTSRSPLEKARFILNRAPGLPLARDLTAQNILQCINGAIDDSEHEEFASLCEDYARVLVGYFNEPQPRPGPRRPDLWLEPFFSTSFFVRGGVSLRRMYWFPDATQERLRRAADELEDAVMKAVREKRMTHQNLIKYLLGVGLLAPAQETAQVLQAKAEGLEQDPEFYRGWFGYMKFKKPRVSPSEWLDICRRAFVRMQAMRDTLPKNAKVMQVYASLGLELFLAGDDETADKIHLELVSWRDVQLGQYDMDFRPHAWYMLVLAAHRRGDIPGAFRLAQQALAAVPEKNDFLCTELDSAGSLWDSGMSISQRLREFIAKVRANPNLPYEDPFENRRPETPLATIAASTTNTAIAVPDAELAVPAERMPWRVPGLRATLVWLEPGTFSMGHKKWTSCTPVTSVTISRGFWMAQHELRLEDWLELMDYNPNRFQDDLNLPVECVSWFEAMEFCRRLTARERAAGRLPAGYIYRLPTEAEWEYACRAGSTGARNPEITDESLSDYAWYEANSGGRIHPVGTRLPNAWGLYDMFGNVSEWCFDRATGRLPGGEVTDPYGASKNDPAIPAPARIARGYGADAGARFHDCVHREFADPSAFGPQRAPFRGFRIVLAPDVRRN